VSDAVRMNPQSKAATDCILDKVTSMWLVNARDRSGGRKQRYKLHIDSQRRSNVHQPCPDDDDSCSCWMSLISLVFGD